MRSRQRHPLPGVDLSRTARAPCCNDFLRAFADGKRATLLQFKNLLKSPWPEKGNALTSSFKHVVVFGELNFRVEMPRHRAESLAAEAKYEEVYLGDQVCLWA